MQNISPEHRSPSEGSYETRLLYARLCELKPGDTVGYAELNQIAGKDVQREYRHFLNKAREWLLRDDRIVTECVPKEGIRRVTNQGHAAVMQVHRQRAHSHVVRGVQKGQCANYAALTRDQRAEHNRELAHLGALALASSESASRALEPAASRKQITSSDAMRALLSVSDG